MKELEACMPEIFTTDSAVSSYDFLFHKFSKSIAFTIQSDDDSDKKTAFVSLP